MEPKYHGDCTPLAHLLTFGEPGSLGYITAMGSSCGIGRLELFRFIKTPAPRHQPPSRHVVKQRHFRVFPCFFSDGHFQNSKTEALKTQNQPHWNTSLAKVGNLLKDFFFGILVWIGWSSITADGC